MSRMGKKPVAILEGVNVSFQDQTVTAKGPKGELSMTITGDVNISIDDGFVNVTPANDTKRARAMWGTTRSNIDNLVIGVKEGFSKTLEITGVGFKAAVQKNSLRMSLGFSHEVVIIIPEGLDVKCPKPTIIEIAGANKQQVGEMAAQIRRLRKPEPYKGKGVKYMGEEIRRKEGKKK